MVIAELNKAKEKTEIVPTADIAEFSGGPPSNILRVIETIETEATKAKRGE